jgi:hypothetical protein
MLTKITVAGAIGCLVVFRGRMMNEDVVNMEIRKFLKKVGVTSQRENEKALQNAAGAGKLQQQLIEPGGTARKIIPYG